jgi:hypothetical protein
VLIGCYIISVLCTVSSNRPIKINFTVIPSHIKIVRVCGIKRYIKPTNLIPVDKDMNSIPIPHKFHLDFRNSVRTIREVLSLLQEKYFYVFRLLHPATSSSMTVRIFTLNQGLSATSVIYYRIMTDLVRRSVKPVEGETEAVEVCFELSQYSTQSFEDIIKYSYSDGNIIGFPVSQI